MAFTKAYAKILADMLRDEEQAALAFIGGKNDKTKAYATPEVIDNLVELELVKRCRSVEENPRELVLLTSKGKKVVDVL